MRDLGHVCARPLAQRRDGVDRGDALRQERVRHHLAQLRRPQVREEDAALRHPPLVDGGERPRGLLRMLVALGHADHHALRRRLVEHRVTLLRKLRVGEHHPLSRRAFRALDSRVGADYGGHRVRRRDRHRRPLHDDLGRGRRRRDLARDSLPVLQVWRVARVCARLLDRRRDGDENHVRLRDGGGCIGGEEEVDTPHLLQRQLHARLKEGQPRRAPRGYLPSVIVDHGDADVRAF
mmetsp:Transcript_36363/g.117171  ORF Transcript_36363/g.117171 Transcript_36363/m.117171 type:complete len:236 (-) Transcript_36363:140-847(-)